MATEPTAEDRMTQDFLTFDEGTPEETAQARLQEENRTIGVYCDADQKATRIVCLDGLHRLLAVERTSTLRDIVDLSDFMRALNEGIPGIFVVEEQKPVGVITKKDLQEYMRNEYKLSTGVAGGESFKDGMLGGEIGNVPLTEITCKTCGTVNKVRAFDEGFTKCVKVTPREHLLIRKLG